MRYMIQKLVDVERISTLTNFSLAKRSPANSSILHYTPITSYNLSEVCLSSLLDLEGLKITCTIYLFVDLMLPCVQTNWDLHHPWEFSPPPPRSPLECPDK